MRQNRKHPELAHFVKHGRYVHAYELLEFVEIQIKRLQVCVGIPALCDFEEFVYKQRPKDSGIFARQLVTCGKIDEQHFPLFDYVSNVKRIGGRIEETGEGRRGQKTKQPVLG